MKEDVREPVCRVTGTVGQDHSEGPLGLLEYDVRAAMSEEGFAPQSARYVIDRMRRLSRWMEQHDVEPAGLTPEAVAEFLTDSSELKTASRGLGTLLRLLRSQSVIPLERDSAGDSAAGMLLARYRDYLSGERGLAAESVRCYLVQGRKLIDELGEPLEESLRQLDAAAVTSFIMRQSRQAASTWSAKTLVTATRSLLRFLHLKGLITAALAGAVPAVAGWRLSALPRGLEPAQAEVIIAAPDPASRSGLRARAILMLLARLGLRGAEAAGLQLADIDWQAGEITVTGKGSQAEAMPLPAGAGQALAGYLTKGRPRCSCTAVFVTARAPYHQITPSVVRALVPRACDHAGLPRAGAHRLRHSLATRGAAGGRAAQRGRAVAPAPQPAVHERLREDRLRAARAGRAAVAAAGREGGRGMTAGQALREHAEEYLAMRRALGFSLTTFGIRLGSFITWLESTGAAVITSDAAIAWATATRRGSTDPAYFARRLDVARIFARHMQVLDPATEVPPMDVLSRRYRRITPHLYPPAGLAAILAAAGELSPPLRAATWQTLLALLAATGMRVSEACRLGRRDAGLDAGVLTIRDSKFGKSRDIPVHPTTVTALRGYSKIRDRLCPAPVTTAFFVSTRGTPIDSRNMPHVFADLAEAAGITTAAGRRRARIHDIRHTFTVTTLLDWHRDGADVQARLPLLPAYLGHVDPKSSYWYMTASPELLGPGRRPALARLRRTAVNDLPALLQGFFTGKLVIQRQASPATVASYRGTFTLLLAFAAARAGRQPHQLQVTGMDAETVGAFLTHLEKDRGSSIPARNARLAAIRSFFRYPALHDPQHAQLIAQVLAIPAKRAGKAAVTWLTGTEAEALTAAPDRNTWHGRRDHALLLTVVHTGLRVSELTGLTIADTNLGDGPHLRCHGKGRKERCTPLTPGAAKILRAWLKERGGQPEDPLFPSRRGTRLSRDTIARLVAVHAETAARARPSIAGKHVTPHTLRHSTAMALLRAGVDTSVIALWLGHESPETTQAYLNSRELHQTGEDNASFPVLAACRMRRIAWLLRVSGVAR